MYIIKVMYNRDDPYNLKSVRFALEPPSTGTLQLRHLKQLEAGEVNCRLGKFKCIRQARKWIEYLEKEYSDYTNTIMTLKQLEQEYGIKL